VSEVEVRRGWSIGTPGILLRMLYWRISSPAHRREMSRTAVRDPPPERALWTRRLPSRSVIEPRREIVLRQKGAAVPPAHVRPRGSKEVMESRAHPPYQREDCTTHSMIPRKTEMYW
jgi:hypothetical protein